MRIFFWIMLIIGFLSLAEAVWRREAKDFDRNLRSFRNNGRHIGGSRHHGRSHKRQRHHSNSHRGSRRHGRNRG